MEQAESRTQVAVGSQAVMPILLSLSFAHLLNDAMQSLIPSIYPLIKKNYHLDFSQIGLITLTYQLTASLLQPLVGHFTDRRPQPFSLATGMCFTLCGLVSLSMAGSFHAVLLSVALVGMGSSVFHPESSRMARLASGGKHGTAQSLFQVGGNTGAAIGPLLAAAIVVPFGQRYLLWFCVLACIGIVVLWRVGRWYQVQLMALQHPQKTFRPIPHPTLSRLQIGFSLFILLALIFSKYFYLASMNNYLTFYLMAKFHISIRHAQVYLFIFLFAVAAGTMIGGPVGDRIGRKYVIWISILGVAPFTLLLPYANLFWTAILSMIIGLILSSAFSAIIVYAQELLPGKVGMISGLFFGLAFGMGGIGSAVLGELADRTSIFYVYHVCSFLPLIGLLAGFLPDLEKHIARS
ncbi:MAG: MFS transporter [Thermoflavifilum sp.]|nr:MFS transporter [Thermoflavifilum sp.]